MAGADAPAASDDSVLAVGLSCVLNGALLLGSLILFEVLLRWPPAGGLLAPRAAAAAAVHGAAGAAVGLDAATAAGLPRGPGGWLRQVCLDSGRPWALDPDALVLVRFCELGFKFSLFGCLLDTVLLPLYASGQNGKAQGFARLSLSHLQHDSPRFWGVIVAAYVLTGVLAHLLLKEWRHFLARRREHYLRTARGLHGTPAAQAQRSLLVECIPQEARSSEGVRRFFEGLLGPGSVHSCEFQAASRSPGLLPEQARALLQREVAAEGGAARQQPLLAAGASAGSPGTAVVAAAHGAGQQLGHRALDAVQVLQDATVGRGSTSTALVTLRSAAKAAEVQQAVLSYDGHWQVQQAPEPRDLIWKNVATPLAQVSLRHKVAGAASVFGLLFWSGPVTLIQGWANIAFLEKQFPAIGHLRAWSPPIYSLLTSYLPVLALIGLLSALPCAFEALAVRYEGHKTKSEVQRIVLSRCFGYQLASLYVTVLSSSVWDAAQQIVHDPGGGVVQLLSQSWPNAAYFTTFVLTKVGTSLPLLLLRPSSLQPWTLWRRVRAQRRVAAAAVEQQVTTSQPEAEAGGTEGERTAPCVNRDAAGEAGAAGAAGALGAGAAPRPTAARCAYGSEAADAALVLVIGLTYSYIAPAILPACALYFGLATHVYRWLFAYVYESDFDSGGKFWYDLFNGTLLGLVLGTLSLVALAVINYSRLQWLVLLPLPIGVAALGAWCWRHLGEVSHFVPLEDAVAADAAEAEGSWTPVLSEVLYRPPSAMEIALPAPAAEGLPSEGEAEADASFAAVGSASLTSTVSRGAAI